MTEREEEERVTKSHQNTISSCLALYSEVSEFPVAGDSCSRRHMTPVWHSPLAAGLRRNLVNLRQGLHLLFTPQFDGQVAALVHQRGRRAF